MLSPMMSRRRSAPDKLFISASLDKGLSMQDYIVKSFRPTKNPAHCHSCTNCQNVMTNSCCAVKIDEIENVNSSLKADEKAKYKFKIV